ncbi:hypothetical protein [Phocaeicola barnesiae]|uniref:hypothetical protein n=1 Tax=Phocaeicola barnesiae TaxID=376804 RepID=UPI0025A3CAAA|nr:hypothetical protein [Phocaeicola barnesiae]MDM8257186.1 hypothetical protein [Phocaeicola barnesiae]
MCSESDFEKLWFMYKTQGEPKGVSINKFCVINNVPYKAFNDWFRKTQKRVVPVVIEGAPVQPVSDEPANTEKPVSNPAATPCKGTIQVTIKTHEGLCIQKKGLDYQGLKILVEKLEGLC